MTTAMLDYEDFDLDTATEVGLPLEDAVREASAIRAREPGIFVRVKRSGDGNYVPLRISAEEVYAEWTGKFQMRLQKLLRRGAR